MMGKIPVVAVVGPTASGKTALGVALAKRFDGEVVSADSMQIYRGLSVATAKPTAAEMDGVAHHMIDVADLTESYSAAKYCEGAAKAIADIHSRGMLPIIVGGTGLYVDSLLQGNDFSDQQSDEALRQSISDEYDRCGGEYMLNKLRAVDSGAAAKCHANNKKRIVRYLELYQLTKMTEAERAKRTGEKISPYKPLYICLSVCERQKLYDRINKRVDEMLENGLVDEVRRYYNVNGAATSSQAIGCKELKPYIDGVDSLENCIDRLKTATRHYAKRQLTWFLRNDKINLMFTDKQPFCDIIDKSAALIDDFLKTEN